MRCGRCPSAGSRWSVSAGWRAGRRATRPGGGGGRGTGAAPGGGGAAYQPGWRWAEHVGHGVGAERCSVEHVGLVVSGVATAAFADGRVVELRPGDLFYIPPVPHDSWVVGDEPYVSLHFLGADRYARSSTAEA